MATKEKSKRTKSQSGKYSKDKGAVFERWIANTANESLKPLGWELSRTARSGGWMATSKDKSLARLRADITVLDTRSSTAADDFPLFLEAKCRESWSFDTLPKVGIERWAPYKWYKDALDKASNSGKDLCLVFSRNQMPGLVMMTQENLQKVCSEIPASAIWPGCVGSDLMVVVTFEVFLEAFVAKYKEIRCP